MVKGESSYMVDTSVAKSVCKPTKNVAEISPCQIPVGLPAKIKKKTMWLNFSPNIMEVIGMIYLI